MRLLFAAALLVALFAFYGPVHASGGSYLVDDASVVGAGKCQLESWLRAWSNGSDGVFAVPACGVGPVELGMALDRRQGEPGGGFAPSVKWQLRNGDDHGVGLAVEANATYGRGRYMASQVYASTSFGLDDARHWMVDLDLGTDRVRGRSSHAIEGVGVAYALDDRWSLLAERFWSHDSVSDQAGVRLALGESSLDLVVGREMAASRSHWVNVGWNAAF